MSVGEGVPVALGDPVGCTVVVRRERSGTELLVLHRAVDGDAVWTTPSGCRRPGEPVYAAARRALREETGLGALDVWAVDLSGPREVFAMQAGRDVRVMVAPDVVDDIEAQVLARDIAKQYEEQLTYPGQIKVTVIRESRATETAR